MKNLVAELSLALYLDELVWIFFQELRFFRFINLIVENCGGLEVYISQNLSVLEKKTKKCIYIIILKLLS